VFGDVGFRVADEGGEAFDGAQVTRRHDSEHLPASETDECSKQRPWGKAFGLAGGT
jgi:hypothetical protein